MSTPRCLTLPAGARRELVPTRRGDLAALVADPAALVVTTAAPVLLLPGYTGSKEDFLAVLAPLAATGRQVVAVDQYGQYESAGSDDLSAYDLDELAQDLLDVVAAIGGQAHVVGHSFGGMVARRAIRLLSANPAAPGWSSVASVTLLSSGPAPISGARTRGDLALLTGALAQHGLSTIWEIKRTYERELGVPEPAADVAAFLRERFVATRPAQLASAAGDLLAEVDDLEPVRVSAVPTLVLVGEQEDVWSADELTAMAARMGADVEVLPGAGHSPAVDQPEATVQALARFWAAVDAG